jgi:UPF0716 protein FxsA
VIFLLLLIGVPVLEVFLFIEVGEAIGWLLALVLLFGTSLLGARLLRVLAHSATERLSAAMSERRAPVASAIDGALRFLGAALLMLPGFATDALGVLLLLAPTRRLARLWLSRHYAGRVVSFAATAAPFASGFRRARPADVESTAVEYPDVAPSELDPSAIADERPGPASPRAKRGG